MFNISWQSHENTENTLWSYTGVQFSKDTDMNTLMSDSIITYNKKPFSMLFYLMASCDFTCTSLCLGQKCITSSTTIPVIIILCALLLSVIWIWVHFALVLLLLFSYFHYMYFFIEKSLYLMNKGPFHSCLIWFVFSDFSVQYWPKKQVWNLSWSKVWTKQLSFGPTEMVLA